MIHLRSLALILIMSSWSTATAETPASSVVKIVSWNAYSKQFIDAPTFRLLPIPETRTYRATITQGQRNWRIESDRPDVALTGVWKEIAAKKFSIAFEWIDANGKNIASEPAYPRVKAPDFGGFQEPPADWHAAADRGTQYLIDVAAHGKAPYREAGVPIWIWSAATPYKDAPEGLNVSYPCITVPNVIWGMMACVRAGAPQSKDAMRLARETADWSLKNRHPNEGKLPLFPYSTVAGGHFEGGLEGQSVNLLRASWYALGLVDLYEGDGKRDQQYLDYARHIATITAKFQALDGSFPYRINPNTGAVIETYSPAAIEFALLVDALKPYGVSNELLLAEQRAVRWMVSYVAATHHWQAIFEDVSMPQPYANLSQFESQMLIRYLCKHRDEDPAYLPAAEALNRWVEDQFVLFGPGSESFDHPVKTPLVFEQFVCWYPMEGHTAHWITSLIELHRATGKQIYLDKAKAAGNAICAQQFDDGSFSTWGARSFVNGKVTGENTGGNWYNANVMAVEALYKLDAYCHAHPQTH
jgi:maltose/maltodextrin transport system substrate-binding protein